MVAKNFCLVVFVRHLNLLPQLTPLILSLLYVTAIIIAASADILRRPTGLRSRMLVFGGEVSYCFYLVHATLLYAVEARIGAMAWDPVRDMAADALSAILVCGRKGKDYGEPSTYDEVG